MQIEIWSPVEATTSTAAAAAAVASCIYRRNGVHDAERWCYLSMWWHVLFPGESIVSLRLLQPNRDVIYTRHGKLRRTHLSNHHRNHRYYRNHPLLPPLSPTQSKPRQKNIECVWRVKRERIALRKSCPYSTAVEVFTKEIPPTMLQTLHPTCNKCLQLGGQLYSLRRQYFEQFRRCTHATRTVVLPYTYEVYW